MSGLNGIYQWKLVCEREDNGEIHSIASGYVANTNKKNINILHIRDDSTAFSLASRLANPASLFYQYARNGVLKDYNLVVDTMTVGEFQALYTATNPYTTATAAQTDKLSNYHLLIMDNPNTPISANNGAVLNITDEMADNLGVLYTNGALGYSNQSAYYVDAAKQSFINQRTYNYLNRYALPTYNSKSQYYIYNSLGTSTQLGQDAAYQTTFLTKTNEGAITRYPYQIENAIKIAPNSYSPYATTDFGASPNSKLIGWYCLSDTKSPVVQETGISAKGTSDELYKGVYSTSPNDVKNNYYLFSNGLCYYSGIRFATADVPGNGEEIKLFINTVVAAYKAAGRAFSPVITIINPEPEIGAESGQFINIKPGDLIDNNFILTFKIAESSSNMDLNFELDDSEPSGSWDDTIYEVNQTDGSLGLAKLINNTNKVVENRIYAVKIPASAIIGSHKLSIGAVNAQGKSSTVTVTLNFAQEPIITIMDPSPIVSETTGYIYADVDYYALDAGESYLEDQTLRVEFKVEVTQDLMKFKLGATSEGTNLINGTGEELSIYALADDMGTKITPGQLIPEGEYVMYIPVTLMKEHNSRELLITATDQNNVVGDTSITLLRRNLFPLD
jgi:hypothetical protein